jgi:hypothetical protein
MRETAWQGRPSVCDEQRGARSWHPEIAACPDYRALGETGAPMITETIMNEFSTRTKRQGSRVLRAHPRLNDLLTSCLSAVNVAHEIGDWNYLFLWK